MSGKTPDEALEHYAQPIQAALSFITEYRLGSLDPRVDHRQVLTFQHGDYARLDRVRQEASSHSGQPTTIRLSPMFLDVQQWFRLIRDDGNTSANPYRVTTDAWIYTLRGRDGREVLSFHWDRSGALQSRFPHLHVGSALIQSENASSTQAAFQEPGFLKAFSKRHIPTARVAVEQIVRMCINEFEVIARTGWQEHLARSEREFEANRSWGSIPPD